MAGTFRNTTIGQVATIISVALAIAGCSHGFFEILQGNTPTGGFGIDSVGPELGLWGQDPAFTLIHNFLITGSIAFTLGLAIIVWSIWFLDRPHAALILLALFIVQTLAGGGIGYIPFYLVLTAWASRIDKELKLLARLPVGLRETMAPTALPLALVCAVLWIAALTESILGFSAPYIGDQATLYTIWITLLAVLILMNVAFLAAAADDLERRLAQAGP